MLDLFSDTPPWQEPLAPGAVVLRRFARERARGCCRRLPTSPASRRFARWSRRAGTPCRWR